MLMTRFSRDLTLQAESQSIAIVKRITARLLFNRTLSKDQLPVSASVGMSVLLSGALALAQAPEAPPTPHASPANAQTPAPRSQARTQGQGQDWAGLRRYRQANAELAPPVTGENRVVFLGDSITDAWGRKCGQFFPGKP